VYFVRVVARGLAKEGDIDHWGECMVDICLIQTAGNQVGCVWGSHLVESSLLGKDGFLSVYDMVRLQSPRL